MADTLKLHIVVFKTLELKAVDGKQKFCLIIVEKVLKSKHRIADKSFASSFDHNILMHIKASKQQYRRIARKRNPEKKQGLVKIRFAATFELNM